MLDGSSNKRRRTSEDFLAFCRIILDYEKYEEGGGGGGRKRIHSNKKNEVEDEDEIEDSKSSSSDDRDKEGYNEVTCYCNKPFSGRPMIECSSCLTWIHLSCAKIKRTNIPDTWNCTKCLQKLSSSPSNTKRASRKRKTSPPSDNSVNLPL